MRARVLLTVGMLLIGAAGARAAPAADPGIADLVSRLEQTWNAGDGPGWGDQFAADADSVAIQGISVHGGKLIGQRHAATFAGVLKGSTMKLNVQKVRMLSPDIAVVDTVQDVTTINHDPAKGGPTNSRQVFVAFVAERQDARWMIVHSQNTLVAPERALLPPPK